MIFRVIGGSGIRSRHSEVVRERDGSPVLKWDEIPDGPGEPYSPESLHAEHGELRLSEREVIAFVRAFAPLFPGSRDAFFARLRAEVDALDNAKD